jgi:hypothetical protein
MHHAEELGELASSLGGRAGESLSDVAGARGAGYAAGRCYYVGHTYLAGGRPREAAALFARCAEGRVPEATEKIGVGGGPRARGRRWLTGLGLGAFGPVPAPLAGLWPRPRTAGTALCCLRGKPACSCLDPSHPPKRPQDLPKGEAAARAALPKLKGLTDKARAWQLVAAAEAAAEAAAAGEEARKDVAAMGLEQQAAASAGGVRFCAGMCAGSPP